MAWKSGVGEDFAVVAEWWIQNFVTAFYQLHKFKGTKLLYTNITLWMFSRSQKEYTIQTALNEMPSLELKLAPN